MSELARTTLEDAKEAPTYPGIPAIVDGSEAIAHVETRISEVACAYPITPTTTMAAIFQAAVAAGRPNLWATPLAFIEPESEHSSASAAEGVALTGRRATNFTAGQGLILMKEVLYVLSGKRLPVVFHVGARALTSQALNIHAGHDDVMGVADTGWGMVFARNAQEAADLTAIARRAAESSQTPFFVVQDGFLTTHTLENVRLPEDELLRAFIGDPREHLTSVFEPSSALMTGVVENQDSYMKGRIAQRSYYAAAASSLERAMTEWTSLTGRVYRSVDAYRCDDADRILVAMGTIADTARAVVDTLRDRGQTVGAVGITTFRPFPARQLAEAIGRARSVTIVERTDEPAAADNPLTRETKAALYALATKGWPVPRVLSVSAGLGSRDVSAGDLAGVFERLATVGHQERDYAVLGVRHPLAIAPVPVDVRPPGAFSLRGQSIGGLGSITTNKLLATIVGEVFGKQVQAYPRYGSEKKGLPTSYNLTIADGPIRTHAELDRVDFVPLHDVSAFALGDPLRGLVDGGTVFIQSTLTDARAIWDSIPSAARADIAARQIRVAALDTATLARSHAPRPDLVLRMQGIALVGAFLRLTEFAAAAGLDREGLLAAVAARLRRFYGKRGNAVIAANMRVVAAAYDGVIDVRAALDDPTLTAVTA
jgi:pyruvate-ferredoxin/flavodoxin oxidoreductase